jgi:hypothetical protein
MNREFLSKMKDAKKTECEAFMLLLPENVRGHVDTIEKELKAIFFECLTECMANVGNQGSGSAADKPGVNKVKID